MDDYTTRKKDIEEAAAISWQKLTDRLNAEQEDAANGPNFTVTFSPGQAERLKTLLAPGQTLETTDAAQLVLELAEQRDFYYEEVNRLRALEYSPQEYEKLKERNENLIEDNKKLREKIAAQEKHDCLESELGAMLLRAIHQVHSGLLRVYADEAAKDVVANLLSNALNNE